MDGDVADLRRQLAEAQARAAAESARAAALEAELRAARSSPSPPRPAATEYPGVRALLTTPVVIGSPSKPETGSVQPSVAVFDQGEKPLSPALAPLSAAASLASWATKRGDALLHEDSARDSALAHLPPWIDFVKIEDATGSKPAWSRAASTVFRTQLASAGRQMARAPKSASSSTTPDVPGWKLPWGCVPEMPTSVREPFHPAFQGEFKSAMSSGDETQSRMRMMDELLTYCMLGMVGSYFDGVPPGCHRFFVAPPVAYALAAFPHVGYLVAVEWVGKLLGTVVSEPFFLGSQRHADAIYSLPDMDLAGDDMLVDLPVDFVRVSAWSPQEPSGHTLPPAVVWRTEPPPLPPPGTQDAAAANWRANPQHAFFKLLRGDGFDAAYFRRLYAVYARLAAAAADTTDPPPAAIIEARLLFGAGEVCVLMPWVHGRDAVVADLAPGGCAVGPVAEALAWLGRHGLLYVDVREPNVRVIAEPTTVASAATASTGAQQAPPRVALLDYDDMVLVDPPPATVDVLLEALAEHDAAFVGLPGKPGGERPALVEALRAAWAAHLTGSG